MTTTTQYIYSMTDTWTAAGTTYAAIKMNVTDTASAAGSLLMDLQLGSATYFRVSKAGSVGALGYIAAGQASLDGAAYCLMSTAGIAMGSEVPLTWTSGVSNALGTKDLFLTRGGAAASLQLGAADVDLNANIVAQTMRTQGALTGGTADQAGKDWTFIASPGKGTGAGGKFIFQAAKAGSTSSTVNTANTVFTIDSVTAYGLFPAGTALAAPLKFTSGPVLTTAAAGAIEFDGVQFYNTIEANNRAAIPAEQYFHLTGDGGTISTIANVFGATSNITLVSGAYYVIDIHIFYLKTTSGAITWTLTNSQAPTNQNIYYEMSPIAGITAPPGTATMLIGQFSKDATAARTVVTGNLATGVDHYARFKIFLDNATGVSLKIQATSTSGTITPRQGSYWFARRVTSGSVGTFVA